MLAFGQVLFGAPWVGVVLSSALACAALAWALMGWFAPRWALLGGLISVVHPQIVLWSHMYWGGSVCMIGGSLVAGAIPRIMRKDQIALNAMILAAGGAILAMSRPYETMVWAILAGATLLGWLLRHQLAQMPRLAARVALPAAAVVLPVIAIEGYYNWRVTGDPWLMPYMLHTRTYMAVPLMFWGSMPQPKTYNNQQLYDQHAVFERGYFLKQKTLHGWFAETVTKAYDFVRLHFLRNLAVLAGVLAVPFALGRSRLMWLAAGFGLAFIAAYAAIPWFVQHYPAAAMVVLFILVIRGLRWIRLWRPRGRPVGKTFVWLCILSCVPMLGMVYASEQRQRPDDWCYQRRQFERRLTNEPGRHLVIVRYAPGHDPSDEWVFNSADIDSQKIIWARHLSAAEDQELIDYYPDRQVWTVVADAMPRTLVHSSVR